MYVFVVWNRYEEVDVNNATQTDWIIYEIEIVSVCLVVEVDLSIHNDEHVIIAENGDEQGMNIYFVCLS